MSLLISQPEQRTPLQRLKSHHLLMVDLELAGESQVKIAEKLDMTPNGVRLVQQSPLYQDELARRRLELEKQQTTNHTRSISILQAAREEAELALVDTMRNGEDPKLKFNAIESILDRCGVGKNTNIAPSMHISVERMDVIVQALQESSLVSNPTAPLFSPPAVEPTGE